MRFAAFTTVAESAGEATDATGLLDNLRKQTIISRRSWASRLCGLGSITSGLTERATYLTRFCLGPIWQPGRHEFALVRWRT